MTEQTRLSFLGVPVTGEPNDARRHTPQKTVEDLAPIMQRVLDDPYFVAFGWTQYTPYFNDGDVCEFGVHTFWVKTRDDVAANKTQTIDEVREKLTDHVRALLDAGVFSDNDWQQIHITDRIDEAAERAVSTDDDDDGEDDYKYEVNHYGKHPSLGGMDGWRDDAVYKGDRYEKWTIARELSQAIEGGEFENVLLAQFGDHARITWTRDTTGGEFEIEEYSHD
jgi:hypothetical protein